MSYTKGDLVAAVAGAAGVTKKAAADAVDAIVAEVTSQLKQGGSVTLTGFGTFKVSARAARTGVNPQTGAKIQIAAKNVPVFRAGKGLKDAVK